MVLARRRGPGSRPPAFPNTRIEVHEAHFPYSETGTVVPHWVTVNLDDLPASAIRSLVFT